MILEYGIIIILILIIICTLRTTNYVMNTSNYTEIYKNMTFDRVKLSEIYDELKTGDLLFFRSAISSFVVDKLIPTEIYKHVAMIVKLDDELYCTESTIRDFFAKDDITNELYILKSGVNTMLLIPRLQYYSGLIFIHKLNKPISTSDEIKLIEYINESASIAYPSSLSLYMNLVFNIKISNDLYCYEYIYMLLKHINIITENKTNVKDISNYIANIYKYQLNDGYKYSEGKQLVYDLIE